MNQMKPPSNIDVEKSLIGLCLENQDNYDLMLRTIPSDPASIFFAPNHRDVLNAMDKLAKAKEVFDLTTLKIQMTKAGTWNDSSTELILGFYDAASSNRSMAVEMMAMHLMELYIKRTMIEQCNQTIRQCYDSTSQAQEILANHQSGISKIDGPIAKNNFRTIAELYDTYLENLEVQQAAINSGERHVIGQSTGLTVVDHHTGGDKAGELIIIAARPGEGKSTYVLNAAMAAAKNGEAQAILSLEMDDYMQVGRIAANEGSIPNNRIQQAKLTAQDWAQLHAIRNAMLQMEIYLEFCAGLHILALEPKIRYLVREKGVKRIFIDYLQLMNSPAESAKAAFDNQNSKVSQITKRLKELAGELGIPIVLLSQMSRDIEKRQGEKRPMLSDLRDSGSIEQDANTVLFLYSPWKYEETFTGYCSRFYPAFDLDVNDDKIAMSRLTFVIIAKQRNGKLMSVPIWNDRKFCRMSDIRETGMYKKTNAMVLLTDEPELMKRLGIHQVDSQLSIDSESIDIDDEFPF
mgnify:CR=1 FL=1